MSTNGQNAQASQAGDSATRPSEPDYLPARMLNEFVYCPRLFYYEWVEGEFAHNRETVEGSLRHKKLDERSDALPEADSLADGDEKLRSRSVMLASDTHRLIAKMDIIEVEDGKVRPVDYKRGSPRQADDGSPEAWDTDCVQLAAQALILRDNGYDCDEGVIYYDSTKQRVRVEFDEPLVAETLVAIDSAWRTAADDRIPPPLVDSPKCPRCSLVGICLPDETRTCDAAAGQDGRLKQTFLFDDFAPRDASAAPVDSQSEVRRLVPARDDLRPLYLDTQGLHVGKSGGVLKIKSKNKVVQEVRINDICQLNLYGNIQLSTQAIQQLCQSDVPIAYFSQGGWFYGFTQGLGLKNIFLRREQFRLADVPSFCLRVSRALVAGKIRNQRTMLQRNHIEPPRRALALMRCMLEDAEHATSLDQLLGIEGNAARIYFENFNGMIKAGDDASGDSDGAGGSPFSFDFSKRNRRPPRDPVNALLSLAYSMLTKDFTIVCQAVGFDPYLGFFHQPRFGRPSLALDLMEPFRALVADSAVLSAINTRMVGPDDFIETGQAVALKPNGRKAFYRAYEQRMDTLVTHPLFGYRVSYRRILEIQTRLLGRVLTGELNVYPVFVTR